MLEVARWWVDGFQYLIQLMAFEEKSMFKSKWNYSRISTNSGKALVVFNFSAVRISKTNWIEINIDFFVINCNIVRSLPSYFSPKCTRRIQSTIYYRFCWRACYQWWSRISVDWQNSNPTCFKRGKYSIK